MFTLFINSILLLSDGRIFKGCLHRRYLMSLDRLDGGGGLLVMYNVITATEKPKKVESNQFITKVCEWLEPFLLLFLFWYGMLVRHRVTSPPPPPPVSTCPSPQSQTSGFPMHQMLYHPARFQNKQRCVIDLVRFISLFCRPVRCQRSS